jgi:hypothetical protein
VEWLKVKTLSSSPSTAKKEVNVQYTSSNTKCFEETKEGTGMDIDNIK